jgi:hypothetical protein
MIKWIFFLICFSFNVQAVLLEGPVHVSYADGSCTCVEGQIDTGMGLSMRVDNLNLRNRGPVVHRPDPPEQPEPPPDPDPPPPPPEEPEPFWKTNVTFFGSEATTSRRQKYNIALEEVERVMNQGGGNTDANEFREDVLNYDSPYTTNRFVAASGSGPISETNAQVYQHHWNGDERRPSTTSVDNEADVEIEFYYENNNVVGYTYSTSRRVWVNTKFFDGYKPSSVASNFYHEWSHKLGYGHTSAYYDYRPYTVPYGIGYTMRQHCQLLDDEYGY